MKSDFKVLGAYCRDVLNENDKLLLLGFAEDNRSPEHVFCTLKSGLSYTFQSAKGTGTFGLYPTKQAGRRLIRCINVRRPR